jgi:hypothetical protein
MENSNRIQINGTWYVPEESTKEPESKNVNWLIQRLQELADAGYGNCKITYITDYGNDWDFINNIEVVTRFDRITTVNLY